ncbi:MAG: type II CAAX endopeptidase family protein [Lachnospiraceae bacterium]|nr:type II CAAX endopeptidase family protein [Lachnospiraceae bacterium]MDY6352113.1 type II CAAX endopeptidase family protein [Lachnospiraceae bacterium]
MSNKGKNILLGILPTVVVFVLQNVISIIVAEFFFVYYGATFSGSSYDDLMKIFMKCFTGKGFYSVTLFIYSIFALVIFGAWFKRNRCSFECRSMSLKGFRPLMVIAGVILFVFGAQIISSFLVSLLSAAFPKELARYMKLLKTTGLSGGITPLMLIYSAILGPISEELVFRGLTLGYFKKSMSFFWANILQALLFGLIHGNLIQFVYAFLLGLMFGFIAHRTGSLLVTIILHISFNSLSFVIETMLPNALSGGAIVAFALLVLSMMGVYIGTILLIASQPMAKEK